MRVTMLAYVIFLSTEYASLALADPVSRPFLPSVLNHTVTVVLPDSRNVFPPGSGSNIANSQCVICHSAGMATRQPRLSISTWTSEINGAPIPEEQIETLAKYLATMNPEH
jgi:hypothetical protein